MCQIEKKDKKTNQRNESLSLTHSSFCLKQTNERTNERTDTHSDGPLTVFVPSNEALRKIPDEELEVIKNNSTALRGE